MAGATLNVSIHNGPNQLVYKKIEYLEFVKICVCEPCGVCQN